jgi:hypothetical protein
MGRNRPDLAPMTGIYISGAMFFAGLAMILAVGLHL